MDDAVDAAAHTAPLPGETPAACLSRIAGQAKIRRVSFGDGEMVWRIWGEGRPVVLLHGGYGAWSHWVRNVLPLSRHFQVIAADLPSHGDSDRLRGRPAREQVAALMARCLDGALPGNGGYDLVGFSLGANLSAAAIAAYGRSPGNLVLVGPGGLGIDTEPVAGLKKWRPDMPFDELNARHRNNLGVIMFQEPSRIDDLAIHIQRENGLRMRYRTSRAGIKTLLRDFLPSVEARLSCVWGDRDIYARGNRDQRIAVMRQSHPELRVEIVPNAAHWVMYEQAGAFNDALLRLLTA